MIDYAALPPEINSARMYSGAGSAPMLAAGAAWSELASEMRSAADSYSSIVTNLTGGAWQGPASASMASAAAPYVAWMNTTAAQAEQTAAQTQDAARAYESAFSMTVPPGAIATNRTQLASLVNDNVLGQNTPAIAAAEAQYGDMWAQDAVAMYGYTGSSAAATQLTPFSQPSQTTTATAAAAQSTATSAAAAASSGDSTTDSLSSLLGSITSSGSDTSTTGLAGLLNDLDGANGSLLGSFLNNATVANFSNAFTTSGLLNPTAMIDSVTCFSYLFPTAGGGLAADASDLAAGLGSGTAGLGSAGLHGLGAAVSAGVGKASALGPLSVPGGWAASAPTLNRVVEDLPAVDALTRALNATHTAVPNEAVGMSGVPMGGLASMTDYEMHEPMYGFRPTVMSRSPAAG